METQTLNAWANLVGVVLSGIAAIYAIHARRSADEAKKSSGENAEKLESVKVGLDTVTKATDGMKDALVEATSKAARAEGKEEGRVTGTADELLRATRAAAAAIPSEPTQVVVVNTDKDPAITKLVK